MLGKMVLDGKSWGFVPPSLSPHKGINIPIDLRMGDYNMDGYPDALTTLYREEDGYVPITPFIPRTVNLACNITACPVASCK